MAARNGARFQFSEILRINAGLLVRAGPPPSCRARYLPSGDDGRRGRSVLPPASRPIKLLALVSIECQSAYSPRSARHCVPSPKGAFMTFRPLHDRVAIRRLEGVERTKGGIIIPDNAKEKPQQGEVIAIGPGKRDENGKLVPTSVEVGDTVLFGKWSGSEVKIDGLDLLIMNESDIMGVVEKQSDKGSDSTKVKAKAA